jgi:NifU-like protein involved in Fe-S cluster formation
LNYNSWTRRYFEAPANAGVLSGSGVFRGAAGDAEQGAWVQFDLQVAAGTVREARFLAFGCPHTIAVAAFVAEQALGAPLAAVMPLGIAALSERFGVPTEKRGRLLIIEDAWTGAINAAMEQGMGSKRVT